MKLLPVSEVYGPVHQGEGPHTGRLAYFLRLGLCNLHCTWCDTPYTWDTTRFDVHAECPPIGQDELVAMLDRVAWAHAILVLSGGEPLIHQGNPVLLNALARVPVEVHVETNGTIIPSPELRARVSHFTVSPKLFEQGDPIERRIRPDALASFLELADLGRACYKVVCEHAGEVQAVAAWADASRLPRRHVWIMPKGTSAFDVIHRAQDLEPAVLAAGMHMSMRQHTILHGTERGR